MLPKKLSGSNSGIKILSGQSDRVPSIESNDASPVIENDGSVLAEEPAPLFQRVSNPVRLQR